MKKILFVMFVIVLSTVMTGCVKDETLTSNSKQAQEPSLIHEVKLMVTAFAGDTLTLQEYLFLPKITIKKCEITVSNGKNLYVLTPELSKNVREPDNLTVWEDLPCGVRPEKMKLLTTPLLVEDDYYVLCVDITFVIIQKTSYDKWNEVVKNKVIIFTETRSSEEETMNIISTEELPTAIPITFNVTVDGWQTHENTVNM